MITVTDAIGMVAGMLTIASAWPQLWSALRGKLPPPPRDIPQIRSRALQLAGNLLWVMVGVIDQRIGLVVPCALSSALLTALLWSLCRRW